MEMDEKDVKEIIEKYSDKLFTVCRLCLATDNAGNVDIGTGNISGLLERCLGITVDSSSLGICGYCMRILTDMDAFRTKSRKIHKLLTTLLPAEDGNDREDSFEFLADIKEEVEIEADPVVKEENDAELAKPADEESRFPCELCGKTLSNVYNLKNHIKYVHDENKTENTGRRELGSDGKFKYRCDECDYSTPYSQSLKYHIRVHSGERPYKCKHCGKSFTQPSSLICHERRHSAETFFTCPDCGKQFKIKHSYEKHKKVHTDAKPYVCPLCDKGLKSKQTLRSHMDRHNNVKNYNCETCGSRFVTLVELINHSKKHSAEKNFQCDKCPYKTYAKKGLEAHARRHSGERLFKCEMCEHGCYTRAELRCHMRTHTKVKNYSCPMCEIRFGHSSSVNKHMLKAHGVKYVRNKEIDRRTIK